MGVEGLLRLHHGSILSLGTGKKVWGGGGGGPEHLERWLIKNTWPTSSLRHKNDWPTPKARLEIVWPTPQLKRGCLVSSKAIPFFSIRTKICNCVEHRGQVNIRKAYSNDPFDSNLKSYCKSCSITFGSVSVSRITNFAYAGTCIRHMIIGILSIEWGKKKKKNESFYCIKPVFTSNMRRTLFPKNVFKTLSIINRN